MSHTVGPADLLPLFLIHFPKHPRFRTIKSYPRNQNFTNYVLQFKSNLLAKRFFSFLKLAFANAKPGFNCTFTFCIICHPATQIAEIFHTMRLFLICHIPHWGQLSWDSHCLSVSTFISIPKHLPVAASLQSRPVTPPFPCQ